VAEGLLGGVCAVAVAVSEGPLGNSADCGTQCDDLWPPEALEFVLARMGVFDEPAAHADESGSEAEDTPKSSNSLYAPSLLRMGVDSLHACSGRCSDGVGVSTADFVQPDGSVMLEAEWRSHVAGSLARSAVVADAVAGGFAVDAWPEEGPDDVQATELAVAPASARSSDRSDEADEYDEGSYSDAYE
jgi:hypothetical protein